MFKKSEHHAMATHANNDTVIAQGVKVEGDFTSQGNVVIDGEVTGSLQTAAALRVGDSAKIHADVTAQSAVVAGEIQGNIIVAEKLELLEASVVHGDIEAKVLSVAAGAKVNGKVSMNGGSTHHAKKEKDEEGE